MASFIRLKTAVIALISAFIIFAFQHSLFAFQNQNAGTEHLYERDLDYLHSLNERIERLIISGELDSIQIKVDEAIQLAILMNDREAEAKAYVHLGNYYLDRILPDSVIIHLEEPYSRLSDTATGLELGNALASAYSRNNETARSMLLQQELVNRARDENNQRMVAGISQNMAVNYSRLGDYESAINHYLNSLEMAEAMADTNIMIVVLDNLGNVNRDAGNFELAERYNTEALDLAIEIGNLRNQLTSHLNLAIVYNRTERYDKAEANLMRVIEIANQIGSQFAVIQANYNLGETYAGRGDHDLAMEMYEESLRLSRENNIIPGIYFNQKGIAELYREQGNLSEAIVQFESALEYANMFPTSDESIPVLKSLSELYAQAGNMAEAYSYLSRYSTIQDSLRQTERDQIVARQEVLLGLRVERETREIAEAALLKEQQSKFVITLLLIALLIILVGLIFLFINKLKANKLLKHKTEELARANEDKDKLLSLLSHDLRAPITSLQGIVQLIHSDLIEGNDLKLALDQVDANLQKEFNTLTNYLHWAKDQKYGIEAKPKSVNVTEISNSLVEESNKIGRNKGVSVVNKIPENTLIHADKQMTSVILRNLISNAIKYTNKEDEIILNASISENEVTLSVKDNGIGIDPQIKNQIFETFNNSTLGTDGERGTGLGLSICKEFAEKQNARLYFESEPGKGTTFYITYKKG